MALIKVESEDMAIEEAFTVKREDAEEPTEKMFIKEEQEEVTIQEDFRVKREDTEEHTEMTFFKEESREVTTEADFVVKREVTEEQTEMPFIKQERDEAMIEEDFRVKREDTEEQTVLEGNTFEHFLCGRIAAGLIQPYMFEPESDPEYQDDEPSTPQIPRALQPVTAWCSCKNCAVMPTEKENICCLEIPQVVRRIGQVPDTLSCMTLHPGFDPVCLNVFSLQNALNVYKADYGRLKLKGREQRYRLLARRNFVSWCWGSLGRTIRVDVPSCVVLRINREFPDTAGSCAGFRPPLD